MEDNSRNAFLGFISGGLVAIVGLMGFLMYSGALPERNASMVQIEMAKPETK
jgi:hypothetical protein